ncbi:hypothetical protein CNBG_4261 [Cryptococcus deuterogattii R265]|uniref:uncharacterized protein n=1 Tax=Cryptococcus deuterogattii (strain R265) TaxID=294750 RepID=UPI001934F551|nr:hypothetical protein CNBG_4261 [Cryptococcus deuterogattii R265]
MPDNTQASTDLNTDASKEEELDTETKLVLLASLVHPLTLPSQALEMLASVDGDVAKAAEKLLLPSPKASRKRKAGPSLQEWLGRPGDNNRTVKAKGKQEDESTGRHLTMSAAGSSKISGICIASIEENKETDGTLSEATPPRPVTNAFDILGRTPSSPVKQKLGPQRPVCLSSQASIDSNSLPLTLIDQPLPPSLASALYLLMLEEAKCWGANRFFIAGKEAKSPHKTGFYRKEGGGYGGGKYYYAGVEQGPAKVYPALLTRAAEIVEKMVNEELRKRQRFGPEWAGEWKANVCGANHYECSRSSVGWHADQLTYLGPYTTIASLSLGTSRAFRLRETAPSDPAFIVNDKPPCTYEITLAHNTLCLMNAGCQERYKHTVPPQKAIDLFRPGYDIEENPIPRDAQQAFTSRINITFRFYREDFHPVPIAGPFGPREGTPVCRCGVPTVLRADQKAKARSRLSSTSSRPRLRASSIMNIIEDDMVFFWQCQSASQTGVGRGCGFFRILDMKKEGRGPCIGDRV